ncbi:SSTR2 [Branchiostoma lanceolatum]|uniref:SSTR2 protein n=1 Tax=Branchiostoma lanceolatum TaxID=7740 RepID=A0A8J9YUV0_BRALA|nr:SSTR2 [Branchiostoma lanceolatum]
MSAYNGSVSLDPSQDFLANWTHVSSANSTNFTVATPSPENTDVVNDVTAQKIPVFVELILAAIGVLANSLVIYVIARYREMRTVPNVFVLNIAVADLLYCFEFVPVWNTLNFLPNGWIFGQAVCTITRALYGICGNASILFVIVMSIERYHAVADPIGHHQRSSKKRTWIISAALWLVSLIFTIHIIAFSKVKVRGTYKDCSSDPSSIVPYEDYIKGILIYRFVAWCVLPLTILIPCYARLYYKLHHGDVIQADSGVAAKSRHRVTRMVTVVVAVFTVSWMPLHIVYLVKFGFHLYSVPEGDPDPLQMFVGMLSSTNSMINPFLYALLGDKFRIYMKKALCCGRGVDKRRYQLGSTLHSNDATRLTQRTLVWENQHVPTSARGKTAETEISSSSDRNKATPKTAEKREYNASSIEV